MNLMALPSRFSSTCRRCRPSSDDAPRHVRRRSTSPAAGPCGPPLRRRRRCRSVMSCAQIGRGLLRCQCVRPRSSTRSSTSLIRSSSCDAALRDRVERLALCGVQARDRAAAAARSRARRSAASAARGSCWRGTRSWRASPLRPTPSRGAARRRARRRSEMSRRNAPKKKPFVTPHRRRDRELDRELVAACDAGRSARAAD